MKKLILAAISLVLTVTCFYAKFVEPYWIEVTSHEIKGKVLSPIKIMHLSDLHVRSIDRRMEKVYEVMEKERPDLIAITGDNVSGSGNFDVVAEMLARLRAPLGVWMVRGNWDNWRQHDNDRVVYTLSNLNYLYNEAGRAREDIWVVGLDDSFVGSPNPAQAFAGLPKDSFRLLLFHSPAPFDTMTDNFDLALAGHTHGGQIRLPFGIPLYLPPHSGRFVNGLYFNEGKKLYVSRGVGTSTIDMRLFCRPEIALIKVVPE